MENHFVLIKLLSNYRESLNNEYLCPFTKQQIINDLCTNSFKIVHICKDTSASAVLRDYLSVSKSFSTFFIAGIELEKNESNPDSIMIKVIERINNAQHSQVIETGSNYQVFTS